MFEAIIFEFSAFTKSTGTAPLLVFNSLLNDRDFQVNQNEKNTITPLIINKLKERFGK